MKRKHLPKLDLLRVFLTAAVLLYHLGFLKGGYLAVPAFFTLSAFLGTRSLLKKGASLKDYYLRRLKRVYLPLLAVTLISVAVFAHSENINWIEMKPETLSVLLSYNNYWQLKANLDYFTRHISSPFMHLWYIAILIQLELLLPFIVMLLKKTAQTVSRLMPLLICLILASASYIVFALRVGKGDLMPAYYGTFARSHAFFLGILQAFFHSMIGCPGIREKKTANLLFYLYLILSFVLFLLVDASSPFLTVSMLAIILFCIRMTDYAYLSDSGEPANLFDSLVSLFAKFSYEVYLVQYPWIYLFQHTRLSPLLQALLVLPLTLVSAFLLHYALDLRKGKTKIPQFVLCALVAVTSLFGGYTWLRAEDHTEEAEEMRVRHEESQKLIEEKNNEYYNNGQMQEEERQRIIDSMDNKEEAVAELLRQMPVTAIGDSITLDLVNQLYDRFPKIYIDSDISRDLYTGNKLLRQLKEEGKLADVILLSLSVNGDFRTRYCEELMEIAEGREVFWVDAVGPDDPNFNERFEDFAKDYDNLHIVEWYRASRGHPEYFYYDGIHVIGEGVPALAQLMYDTIYNIFYTKYADISQEVLDQRAEEARKRVAFYGNDALLYAYGELSEAFPNSLCNTKEYTASLLLEEIGEKAEKGTLEYKLVFLFDKNTKLSEKDYKKLLELCEGHEIYIFNLTKKKFSFENAAVIDFYEETKAHPEYLMKDKVHLTDEGNKALTAKLREIMQ